MSASRPASAPASNAATRLGGMDLFRFILCAFVVFGHYWYMGPVTLGKGAWPTVNVPWISLLEYAVQGFFMISGFAIMYTIRGRTAVAFAIQRIARMWPAMAACSLITWLAVRHGFAWSPGPGQVANTWMIFPLWQRIDAGADWSYWTMTYELRFYVMIFLAMVVTDVHRFRLPLLAAWLALTIVDVVQPGSGMVHFIALDWYSGCFIIGALTYVIWEQQGMSRRIAIALLFPAFAVTSLQVLGENSAAHDSWRHIPMIGVTMWVVPVVSWALLVGSLMIRLPRGLEKFAAFLGVVTFPLYLLHQLVGYRIINDMVHVLPPDLRWLAPFIATALVSVAASAISLWLEPLARPVIQNVGRSIAERFSYTRPAPRLPKADKAGRPMVHAE